jgi:CHAT domain-containing protein/tetratricopeptide (TPR) repeat protein
MALIEAVVERLVMAGGRLAAMLVAGLLGGVVLAGAAHAQGPDDLTQLLDEVGRLQSQGRFADAVPIAEKAVALARERHGEEHDLFGSALGWLAVVYQGQGRFTEAEPLHTRSLAVREKAWGPDHPNVGAALHNLAVMYREQGRYADAEPLLRRSLAIAEKQQGPEHPIVGTALNQLAGVLRAQRRYGEAEALYRRSIAIGEKALGQDHPTVGNVLNGLAELYVAQGRYADAEPLLKRHLGIFETALDPEHPNVGTALLSLAGLHLAQGRYAAAEPLLRRSLDIYERALGPEHPHVRAVLNNLAQLAYMQSDWATAASFWRRSTSIIKRRAERGLADGRGPPGGEAQRLSWQFRNLVRTTHRLAVHGASVAAGPAAEMLETAQWALGSEAAASLAQMAARSAKGSPRLAGLVRERQDLVSEWQAKDKQLIASKSQAPAKRDADAEKALAGRLAAIDIRLADIDRRLGRDFPDYAALASPTAISVVQVQAQLGADEALVLFLDTPENKPLPEETFIWVVTKTDTRWGRSDLGTAALAREVAALRCGLDATVWYGEGTVRCAKALGLRIADVPRANQPLPFDHHRAHKLYSALFAEVQDLIRGKHLLVVASGPLTQLPLQVLVTEPPASGDHRAAAWLIRDHAVTVLPAVSSLQALRRVGKPSTAPRPMIGFANPLLDGPDASYADSAKLARDKQRCAETGLQRMVARRGVQRVQMRGSLADVSHIKGQVPLPETADELCAVAQDVKAVVARDVRLGAQATEREIKRLSASGELAKYRMVHFATHGTLAGQLSGTDEPGLILTPPDRATEEDDGYLSASEIAGLKLDADWVILSACNTAAGGAASADALSGLARAFIYAQARALLVSHWEVYSDAAVKLVTTAVRDLARDPRVGRAEAMRRSMLALIDKGEPREAHPAFWAPFVVVGEGAAGK